MLKFIFFFILCLFSGLVSSQEDCPYVSLKFGDVEPLWQHLVVDSTIIGYIDSNDIDSNETSFINGANHLFSLQESLLFNGYIYSVTPSYFDADISGYVLEKINVETGVLEWKVITDNRTEEFDYKVMKLEVVNNELHTFGVSSAQSDYSGILGLVIGYEDSYYYKRVYHLETGALLREMDPSNDNENAAIVHSEGHYNHNFFGEEIWEEFEYADWIDGGPLLTRKLIDTLGNDLGIRDTIRSDWEDTWSSDNQSSVVNKFAKAENDTYLYIQEFIPKEGVEGMPTYANATVYDADLNILNKVDLIPLLGDSILLVTIREYTTDRIVLRVNYSSFFEHDYFFFDTNFNFIKKISKTHANEYVEGPWFLGNLIRPNDDMYFGTGVSLDDDFSYLSFYKSNEEGTLDSIRRLYFEDLEWVASVQKYYIMDNGDYVINLYNGCKEDNVFTASYSTWLRISADEFVEPVSLSDYSDNKVEVSIYPNPTSDIVRMSWNKIKMNKIQVFDFQGHQLIKVNDVEDGQVTLDLGNLSRGMYIVRLTSEQGNIVSKRIVKE